MLKTSSIVLAQAEGTAETAMPDKEMPTKRYHLEKDVDLIKLEETTLKMVKDVDALQTEVADLKSNLTNGVAFAGLVIAVMIFLLFRKSDS